MHEEPTFRSLEEAIVAFQKSRADLLILGPFIVRQDGADESTLSEVIEVATEALEELTTSSL